MSFHRNTITLAATLLIVSTLNAYPYRLLGPNGATFWSNASIEYTGIFPIDDGRSVALVWGGQRPDADHRDVYFQILDAEGNQTYNGNYAISDSTMVNSEDIAVVTDREGNIFVAWLAAMPGDESRFFLYAQKISPNGEIQWGVPPRAVTEFPHNEDWDFWYGSSWSVFTYPDENGGVICVTNQGIGAFDSNGEPREDWQAWDERPPEGLQYNKLIPDDLGGIWIEWWYNDREGPEIYAFNHLGRDGSRLWEEHRLPEDHFRRINGISSFPRGIGWQGGWISVIKVDDQCRLFIFDSLAETSEDNIFELPSTVTSTPPFFTSDTTIGILYELEEEFPYSLMFIRFNLNDRAFIGSTEGRTVARWDEPEGYREELSIGGSYFGRGNEGEYYFGVKCHLQQSYVDWTEIHVLDHFARQTDRGARFDDLVMNSGKYSMIENPGRGFWLGGGWPYRYKSFYINHYDYDWNPVSPIGFAPEIYRGGSNSTFNWFSNNESDNCLFFSEHNGLRMINVDASGNLEFPAYGKWVLPGYLLSEISTSTNQGVVAAWRENTFIEGPLHIALFDDDGEVAWTRLAVEDDNWIDGAQMLITDPSGESVVLLLLRKPNNQIVEPVLIWINAEDGTETARWEGLSLESNRIRDNDIKRFLKIDGDSILFAIQYSYDPIIIMKFASGGDPIWEQPLVRPLPAGSYFGDVFFNRFGGADICGIFREWDEEVIPWIVRLNGEGELIDSIGVYEHPARGNDQRVTAEKWIKSASNLWLVPDGMYLENGPDSAGIQMIDSEGQRIMTDQGFVIKNPDGSVPSNWNAVSDSVGGIWFWARDGYVGDHSRVSLLHFTSEGTLDENFPEYGIPLRADSLAVYSDQMVSLPGGDLGMFMDRYDLVRRTEATSIQRFSLREPPNSENSNPHVPTGFALHPPYPNPFNANVIISFSLPVGQVSKPVSLCVYDLSGRLVQALENGPYAVGEHKVVWDAGEMPAGIYLVRLEANGAAITRKTILIR